MSDKTRRDVGRLLRVLVAGGMALAGAAGVRADDKGAPTEKTEKAKEKNEEQEKAKAEKAEKAEKERQRKKAEEEKRAAQPDGGGVPGW
jgi:hypothetical protein